MPKPLKTAPHPPAKLRAPKTHRSSAAISANRASRVTHAINGNHASLAILATPVIHVHNASLGNPANPAASRNNPAPRLPSPLRPLRSKKRNPAAV